MNIRIINIVGILLAILSLTIAAAVADPSAARVVPGDCVDGQFDVQITASGTGLGQIKETLCDGWTYVGSTMDPDQVSVSGNTVMFTVFSFPQTFTYTVQAPFTVFSFPQTFTYTVQAPATPGATCTISGIVKDTVNTAGVPIAGQQVSVCSDQNGPSDPSAARVVPGDCVDGQFDVQITASGTGLGQIKETLGPMLDQQWTLIR